MNQLYQANKTNTYNNTILSATRPETTLKTGYETQTELYTKTIQKSKIKIYVDNNKFYIDHGTAYALGLINTRAIMLNNNQSKLVEISSDVHNKLQNNESMEIEYVNVARKQKLQIYVDGSDYCIDMAAAYALGLVSAEEFSNQNGKYYITEDMAKQLSNNYDVEFYSLGLVNTDSNGITR